jgi:Protein of unknown function (DUF3137)
MGRQRTAPLVFWNTENCYQTRQLWTQRTFEAVILASILVLVSLLGILWMWVTIVTSAITVYVQNFKNKIIKPVLRFIVPDQRLEYTEFSENYLVVNDLIQSKIFERGRYPFDVTQDDCVSGRVGEVDINFSEVRVSLEKQSIWNLLNPPLSLVVRSRHILIAMAFVLSTLIRALQGLAYIEIRSLKRQSIDFQKFQEEIIEGRVTRKMIFKGLFFRTSFNKKLNCQTIILPKTLLKMPQNLSRFKGENVRLEDPEFERLFEVYADDQVEARYALSTSLMAKLVDFRKKAKRKVYLSLVKDRIFVAVASDRDLFEPRIFSTMLDFSAVQEYFEDLQLMIRIVDDLNLNRRIWIQS